jgi:hypothetical protein
MDPHTGSRSVVARQSPVDSVATVASEATMNNAPAPRA